MKRCAPLLIAALATACGCSDDAANVDDTNDGDTGGTNTAGGVGGSAGTTAAGGAAGTTAGAGGAAGTTAGAGGAAGTTAGTTGDPDWRTYEWIAECDGVEYAATPANAVPRLNWVPCEGDLPGCTRLDTGWDRDQRGAPPLTPYAFTESDGALYLTASVNYRDQDNYEVVYQDGEPVFVARDNADDCGFSDSRLTASGICATLWTPDNKWVTAWFDWRSPADAARVMWPTVYDRTFGCSDERRFASGPGGFASVTDSATGTPKMFRWEGEGTFYHLTMAAYETHALEIRSGGTGANPVQDGWLWTPERGLESLLNVPGQALLSLLSDGDELAWVQIPGGIADKGDGELWKSSFSLTSTGLAPVKVADVRAATLGRNHKMGGGNYALLETGPSSYEGKLHVYRLSDGHHWELPRLPNYNKPGDPSLIVPVRALRVTETEVWWLGAPQVGVTNHTIVRQSLAALSQ
jgi:hypothetical protein